jgi:hypothetical protein
MNCAILTRSEAEELSDLLYAALPLADARDLAPRPPAPNAALVLARLRRWYLARSTRSPDRLEMPVPLRRAG